MHKLFSILLRSSLWGKTSRGEQLPDSRIEETVVVADRNYRQLALATILSDGAAGVLRRSQAMEMQLHLTFKPHEIEPRLTHPTYPTFNVGQDSQGWADPALKKNSPYVDATTLALTMLLLPLTHDGHSKRRMEAWRTQHRAKQDGNGRQSRFCLKSSSAANMI